jgi:hypothetical protein
MNAAKWEEQMEIEAGKDAFKKTTAMIITYACDKFPTIEWEVNFKCILNEEGSPYSFGYLANGTSKDGREWTGIAFYEEETYQGIYEIQEDKCEDCEGEGVYEKNIPGGENSIEMDVEVFCHCDAGRKREIAALGFDPRQRFAQSKIQEIP